MRALIPLLILSAPAMAGPAPARELAVPADKGWKHAATGLVLPRALDGLGRTGLSDTTATEHDVSAQFASPDRAVEASVFLFRPAVTDASLWFDRARTALEGRDLFRDAAPASADPVAFVPPQGGAASALRQAYSSAGARRRRSGR